MRRQLITLHLVAAAFLAPAIVLVAVSGGLYLLGIKGQVTQSAVELPAAASLDPTSAALQTDIETLLRDAGIEHDFEYVKVSGSTLYTRPTSRTHYQFDTGSGRLTATRNEPDLQKSMIELHKGHGPLLFKDFQKVFAAGLLFIVLSGLWLGLAAPGLRFRTMLTSGAGLVVFLVLGFVV